VPDTFLTGGTGFIGGALLQRLRDEGRSIRALVRTPTDADRLAVEGVRPVGGDLLDPASYRSAMEGCDTVFHVAGLNAMCLYDRSALERVNVDGTGALIAAAGAAGVHRVVYTSSAATLGEPVGEVGTEATEHRGWYITAYERSKHLAEVAAFEAAAEHGIDLVAVNPSSVQGPGRTGGTARILIGYLRGRLRYAVDTRLSLVSIGDAVQAHLAAELQGTPGERYLVSGWTATVPEAVAILASITGAERRVRYVPTWLMSGTAAVTRGVFGLFRRDAPLCPEMVRALRHGHTYDGSRIEREWGFEYTPPEVWLAETVAWYRAQGLVVGE
jgi:dihydroflavonol-4-reductase